MSTNNKRECFVRGKLGYIVADYGTTVDVYLYSSKMNLNGVHKDFVKLKLTKIEQAEVNSRQLKLDL